MRLERRRLGTAVGLGVLAGALYGVLQGLGSRSAAAGAINGVMSAAMFTAVFYAGRRANEHLAGLGYGQRRAVIRAGETGSASERSGAGRGDHPPCQLVQGGVRTQLKP